MGLHTGGAWDLFDLAEDAARVLDLASISVADQVLYLRTLQSDLRQGVLTNSAGP